jgi:hypothetical protein
MKSGTVGRGNVAVARDLSRRDFLKGLAAMSLAAGGGLAFSGRALAHTGDPAGMDALEHHTYDKLKDFTDWLKREGVRGYIGEVGWAGDERAEFGDQAKWNALADKWFGWADAAGLWVTAHDANERQMWGGYEMSIYASSGYDRQRAICQPKAHARVLEAHPSTASYSRGLNIPSGQNIDRKVFHQGNLGAFNGVGGNSYWYPGVANDGPGGQNTFQYLYGRGVRVVRLGFRWERFMPQGPGTELNETELQRYRQSVDAAGAAGLGVIMDVHNYGGYRFDVNGRGVRYPINSPKLTIKHFADLWSKLSKVFKDDPAVVAYDLMNEPSNDGGIAQGTFASKAKAWEFATQLALDSIRANGDGTLVMVPTYGGAGKVQKKHKSKWISDRANNHMYTAHQYFDTFRGSGTGGGHYVYSYDNEVAYLQARGF